MLKFCSVAGSTALCRVLWKETSIKFHYIIEKQAILLGHLFQIKNLSIHVHCFVIWYLNVLFLEGPHCNS